MCTDGDPGFSASVRGRRVVLVGPARTLVGRGQGAAIDAADVVVRINDTCQALARDSTLAADMGTRTDVLYVNPSILRHLAAAPSRLAETNAMVTGARGLRWVVCTNNALEYSPAASTRPADWRSHLAHWRTPRALDQAVRGIERLAPGVRVRMQYAASALACQWLDGAWPRTGFAALVDLLMMEAAEVRVCGMTFYHGGGHLLAPPDARLEPDRNRDGSHTAVAGHVGHDSVRECECVRVLRHLYPQRLRIAADLAEILALHYDSTPWPRDSH